MSASVAMHSPMQSPMHSPMRSYPQDNPLRTPPPHRRLNGSNRTSRLQEWDDIAVMLDFAEGLVSERHDQVVSDVREKGIRLPACVRETEGGPAECTICLDTVHASEGGALSCGHSFHTKCITNWFLGKHFNCPNCRQKVDVRAFIKQ